MVIKLDNTYYNAVDTFYAYITGNNNSYRVYIEIIGNNILTKNLVIAKTNSEEKAEHILKHINVSISEKLEKNTNFINLDEIITRTNNIFI